MNHARRRCLSVSLGLLVVAVWANMPLALAQRPNVVLIMSDDQGYGDFGETGNALIETPHIDAMAQRSASMTTFYVSPVCSPTRACLMTGRYNYRTRCIDTYFGRSMMEPREVTIAEVLRDAGYATGIFGKWHLGDCYPMRAMDQGFEETLVLKGGGLAQSSEPLANNRRYTDPILFHNGSQVQTTGYCTDVFFDAAIKFIEKSKRENRSFFAYVPTNAPHGPFHDVPEKLYEHYMQKDLASLQIDVPKINRQNANQDTLARICAMITNIDQNVGRLFERLDRLELTNKTIVIYMVDNGPNSSRYVGPFRGSKSHVHEGGIRSPFWMHWPNQLKPGVSSDVPVAHIDVMPTLLEACEVDVPSGLELDGRSFLPLLLDKKVDWPNRFIALQSHRGDVPMRYHHFMIRDNRWKLLHSSGFHGESFSGDPQFELYDLLIDPGETRNLAAEHQDQLTRLKRGYDDWFEDVSNTRPDNYDPPRIHIGTPRENPTVLTRQDWRAGQTRGVGEWHIHIASAAKYDIQFLFKRPVQQGQAKLSVGIANQTTSIDAGAKSCDFTNVSLPAGDTTLKATVTSRGNTKGVYQVIVKRR